MQGYGTMVMEADQQLKEQGVERPTHVFVQADVYKRQSRHCACSYGNQKPLQKREGQRRIRDIHEADLFALTDTCLLYTSMKKTLLHTVTGTTPEVSAPF